MGTVYRATHENGSVVAIKILPVDDGSSSSTMAARFKREIQACLGTKSPHVIQLYEAGVEEDCHWYSMELLEGHTLQQMIKARGRIPRNIVYRICTEISLALEHIHERGIIHRDLKPGNVMIVRGGRTVLMDFGLAKVADRTRITKTGHGLGTPRYMAPEMLLAKPPTPATDVYQLGVILYELLTGATVVKAKSFATLAHELTRVYPPRILTLDPSLEENLDTLVFNCLEKDQKRRYQSARQFLEDLDRCQRGESIEKLGEGRTLTLGESSEDEEEVSEELATEEMTMVDGGVSRPSRLPPDSRPSASGSNTQIPAPTRPRGSSSFSSVAPQAPSEMQTLVDQVRQRMGHPALWAGVAAMCLLPVLVYFSWGWSGDTGLTEPIRVAVSPAGVQVRFSTVSKIPSAVRLFRKMDGKSRDYLKKTPAAQTHDMEVAPLVQGRDYACEVLFPDGESRHRVEFSIPDTVVLQEVKLERPTGGKPVLSFKAPFPVSGRVRQEGSDGGFEIPFRDEPKREWSVALLYDDPFAPLSSIYLELEGAGGWKDSFGPYSFDGLDGQLVQNLNRVDVEAILFEAENERLSGRSGGSILPFLRSKLQAKNVLEDLQRLRPHVDKFFSSSTVSFDRKTALFRVLQKLAPIDFYCIARNLPAILEVDRLYARFVKTTRRPSFQGPSEGNLPAGWVRLALTNPDAERFPLLPHGSQSGRYSQKLDRTLFGSKLSPRGLPRSTVGFTLPSEKTRQVSLSFQVGHFSPEYYLEVILNGEVSLLIHSPDPSKGSLPAGKSPVKVSDITVQAVVEIPTELVKPGRNQMVITLKEMGQAKGGPTWIEGLDVYYRRGDS